MHCSKRGEHCAIIKALRFAKASTIGPFDNTSITSAGLADYLVRKNPPKYFGNLRSIHCYYEWTLYDGV